MGITEEKENEKLIKKSKLLESWMWNIINYKGPRLKIGIIQAVKQLHLFDCFNFILRTMRCISRDDDDSLIIGRFVLQITYSIRRQILDPFSHVNVPKVPCMMMVDFTVVSIKA
jgi:hypothetical protein